jgi:SPP1 family predicted phage head-tail adaptor
MRAGTMDRRIRIERAQRGARTASGQPTKTWILQAAVWAEVTRDRGQEAFRSNAFGANAEIRFRIRYPANLDPLPSPSEDCRLVFEGKAFDIVGATELGRREGLELWATTRAEVEAA